MIKANRWVGALGLAAFLSGALGLAGLVSGCGGGDGLESGTPKDLKNIPPPVMPESSSDIKAIKSGKSTKP